MGYSDHGTTYTYTASSVGVSVNESNGNPKSVHPEGDNRLEIVGEPEGQSGILIPWTMY